MKRIPHLRHLPLRAELSENSPLENQLIRGPCGRYWVRFTYAAPNLACDSFLFSIVASEDRIRLNQPMITNHRTSDELPYIPLNGIADARLQMKLIERAEAAIRPFNQALLKTIGVADAHAENDPLELCLMVAGEKVAWTLRPVSDWTNAIGYTSQILLDPASGMATLRVRSLSRLPASDTVRSLLKEPAFANAFASSLVDGRYEWRKTGVQQVAREFLGKIRETIQSSDNSVDQKVDGGSGSGEPIVREPRRRERPPKKPVLEDTPSPRERPSAQSRVDAPAIALTPKPRVSLWGGEAHHPDYPTTWQEFRDNWRHLNSAAVSATLTRAMLTPNVRDIAIVFLFRHFRRLLNPRVRPGADPAQTHRVAEHYGGTVNVEALRQLFDMALIHPMGWTALAGSRLNRLNYRVRRATDGPTERHIVHDVIAQSPSRLVDALANPTLSTDAMRYILRGGDRLAPAVLTTVAYFLLSYQYTPPPAWLFLDRVWRLVRSDIEKFLDMHWYRLDLRSNEFWSFLVHHYAELPVPLRHNLLSKERYGELITHPGLAALRWQFLARHSLLLSDELIVLISKDDLVMALQSPETRRDAWRFFTLNRYRLDRATSAAALGTVLGLDVLNRHELERARQNAEDASRLVRQIKTGLTVTDRVRKNATTTLFESLKIVRQNRRTISLAREVWVWLIASWEILSPDERITLTAQRLADGLAGGRPEPWQFLARYHEALSADLLEAPAEGVFKSGLANSETKRAVRLASAKLQPRAPQWAQRALAAAMKIPQFELRALRYFLSYSKILFRSADDASQAIWTELMQQSFKTRSLAMRAWRAMIDSWPQLSMVQQQALPEVTLRQALGSERLALMAWNFLTLAWRDLSMALQSVPTAALLHRALYNPKQAEAARLFLASHRDALPSRLADAQADHDRFTKELAGLWDMIPNYARTAGPFRSSREELRSVMQSALDAFRNDPEKGRLFMSHFNTVLTTYARLDRSIVQTLPDADHWLVWAVSEQDVPEIFLARAKSLLEISPRAGAILLGAMGPHMRSHFDPLQDRYDLALYPDLLRGVLELAHSRAAGDNVQDLLGCAINAYMLPAQINLDRWFPSGLRPETRAAFRELLRLLPDESPEWPTASQRYYGTRYAYDEVILLADYNARHPDAPVSFIQVVSGRPAAQSYLDQRKSMSAVDLRLAVRWLNRQLGRSKRQKRQPILDSAA